LELQGLAVRRKTAQALARWARACAGGSQNQDVATTLSVDKATLGKWRRRLSSAGSHRG